MNNPYMVSPSPAPTGEGGNPISQFFTYGVPGKQTTGLVAGNTERLLRTQIGEWCRLVLFILAWCGMIGFVALIIWLYVIIAKSPNSPPIEAVQLIPGLVSIIAVGMILMMLETSGRIKFYIYTAFSELFVVGTLVIIILWYVYFTSFIFTCNNPDPATLAIFLCQAGESRNTQYASFAFAILGTMMTVIAMVLVGIVGVLAPPKHSSVGAEMNFNYWKQAANIPTTAPRVTIPNFKQYMPFTLTNRKNQTPEQAYETVMQTPVAGPYYPQNPWNV